MSGKRGLWLRLAFTLSSVALCLSFTGKAERLPVADHPYASNKPIVEPAVFAEGIISTRDHESGTAFTPDGETIYFVKSAPDLSFRAIVFSRFEKGKWGTPEAASFSGQYSDTDPFIHPDGSKLLFVSNRPVSGTAPRSDFDIWVADREGNGWGEPRHLDPPVNSDSNEGSPCVTAGGTLYFSSNRRDGAWTKAANLGDKINSSAWDFSPAISPDGKYLFFTSSRGFGARPQPKRLTYQELIDKLRGPRNGLRDIYQIDIDALRIDRR